MKTYNQDIIQNCYNQVLTLHAEAKQLEYEYQEEIIQVPDPYKASAVNLLHYLAIRKHDIRDLQRELGKLGLSSLGRSESHVVSSLENVLNVLQHLSKEPLEPPFEESMLVKIQADNKVLDVHADQLLGLSPQNRNVRIMVTLPSHAATDQELISDLMTAGMDIARINCAHDNEAAWMGMINNIRLSEKQTNKKCLVLMDLAGPKLRTGDIETGPAFLHAKPQRNERGIVLKPTVLKIVPESKSPSENGVIIKRKLFNILKVGDILSFNDIPGRPRSFKIIAKEEFFALSESKKSIYIENGTKFKIKRKGKKKAVGHFAGIAIQPAVLRIFKGDRLHIFWDNRPGKPAKKDKKGITIEPASIPCSIEQIYSQVKPGESILFDDGKIAGIVEDVLPDKLYVLITRARNNGAKLTCDKGINFPDSDLNIPPVTNFDRQCLSFALIHADLIGFSFVKQPEDIELLQKLIDEQTSRNVGLILKIETRMAFENLPSLILMGLKKPPLGVMVARGDLGIEMGFERMAEVQEEILWLCEAAHVPVIWATQVLEQLNKTGLPSRSEVTDAAMSARAECVMLNKGTYMVNTVKFLQDILIRMQDHQQKKTSTLRRLQVSEKV